MAIGLTMARFRLDSDAALQYLIRASSSSQLKLRVIARELIDEANSQYGRA